MAAISDLDADQISATVDFRGRRLYRFEFPGSRLGDTSGAGVTVCFDSSDFSAAVDGFLTGRPRFGLWASTAPSRK